MVPRERDGLLPLVIRRAVGLVQHEHESGRLASGVRDQTEFIPCQRWIGSEHHQRRINLGNEGTRRSGVRLKQRSDPRSVNQTHPGREFGRGDEQFDHRHAL